MSCSNHTPLSWINIKGTFEDKCFDFEVNVLRNGKLVIFELFGDLVENGLTLSTGGIHEIFKDFFESIELDVLLVDFFVDDVQWGHDFVKMLLFLIFSKMELVFDGPDFLKDLRELLMFLVLKIVFKGIELIKKNTGPFLVIELIDKGRSWNKGNVFGTAGGTVHLRVHLVIGNCESSIMVLFELIISIFFICCFCDSIIK